MIRRIIILVNFLLLAQAEETFTTPETNAFSDVVQEKSYVDKTGLLIDFVSRKTYFAVYVTAPRRFGKTTNNYMIKDFFNISFEEDGYTLIKDKTKLPRYQQFKTLKHLKVVQNEEFFEKHFGNYIVVYIDLGEFSTRSEEDLRDHIILTVVNHAFIPFRKWWLFSGSKEAIDKDGNFICKRILTQIFSERYDDVKGWSTALSCLFVSLREHYNKEVILVVDEFDKSILESLRYLSQGSANSMLQFLSDIFGGLTKSPLPHTSRHPVYRVLLTGITQLHIGPDSARMTAYNVYPYFVKNPLSKYYGFNQIEVDALLKDYNLEHKKEDLKTFYDGYKVIGANWQNYNPLSFTKFLTSGGVIQSYWRVTSTVPFWFQFCHDSEVLKNIELLALGQNISLDILPAETITDLQTMKEVLHICELSNNEHKPITIKNRHRIYFFKYLLFEGYLSPADPLIERHLYAAPNEEIREQFSAIYGEYASRVMDINLIRVANVFWSMVDTCSINDEYENELSENFNRLVQNQRQNQINYHYNEQALRSMVFMSCAHKVISHQRDEFVFAEVRVIHEASINIKWSDTDTIRYELEEKNYGKADVYLRLNDGKTIVIIEFKAIKNTDVVEKQVLSYRPREKDQKTCEKLVLVWLAIPPCQVKKPCKLPLQMVLENEIKVSVGCYVFENYDPDNPVAQKCADPKNPIPPGTVPKNFFLKPIE